MTLHILRTWLHDAYITMLAQIRILEQYSHDFEQYPDISSEIHQHLLEITQQAQNIREYISDLGGNVDETPDIRAHPISKLAAQTEADQYNDELIRQMTALYAAEHYGQIVFLALSQCARTLGEDEIADTCERIAEEEEAMAELAREQISILVLAYVAGLREEA